jgi:hypothetical protein
MFVVHKKQNNVHNNQSRIQEEILVTDSVTISRKQSKIWRHDQVQDGHDPQPLIILLS